MAHSFITPDNIAKRCQNSKEYTGQLTEPFPEFQRIARNRPFSGIDPAYPKTTDGTTASIVQKTGKRVVQQLPTGVVESDADEAWLPIVAQFVYTHKIIPYANEDYGLFEKSHLVIEGGLTFGSTCSMAPFLNHDGYFCPDMVLPYWGDVFLQKGKKSGSSCSYIFIRAWWQKADVEALIESETKLASGATERGEEYESTWDTTALQTVLDKAATKDQQAQTPDEKERGVNAEGIELVTAFQKGIGAKFYTFHPDSKEIVRTKTNKDPRGKIPIDWFYGDIDGNNPLGRGIVELVGGLQNLIDSDMQMYQYNRALMLAPPVMKYGNVGNFKFAPNFVIDMGSDPTAKIVPLTIDTTAVENYPQLYGLQKSQLLNLVNSPDTSISSDVGNPGFGKTPEALSQSKAAISVDDNAVRKRFETWFEGWSETAINLYFAERTGKEVLQLDSDTADKLRKLAAEGKFDETLLNDNDELMIDYDTATPALKFRVDASTSKMKDDADQLQGLELLSTSLTQSPWLVQVVPQDKQIALWNKLVAVSGVEDPEELSIDLKEFQAQQQQAQEAAQQQASAMGNQPQVDPQTGQPLQAQPPVSQPAQPQFTPQDEQFALQLKQLGLSDNAVAQAMQMLSQGANEQQVLQALQGAGHV